MCDLRMFILKEMDHSIGTLSPVKVAEIPEEKLLEITENSARLTRALWWNSLVEEAIAREWTVNVGRRDAAASSATQEQLKRGSWLSACNDSAARSGHDK